MLKNPLLNLMRANAGRGQKFKVSPANAAGEVVFWFYDAIGVSPWDGGGIDPLEVAQSLAGMSGGPVRFRIHSPGGDALDGRAIATAIAAYKGPTVSQIDGVAASAASYIALAADEVEMGPGSFLMIHCGMCMAIGDKDTMLEAAGMLETFDNSLIADYARQTGNPPEQIQTWLEAETWFEADDAVEAGFADRVIGADGGDSEDEPGMANRFDLAAYAHAPAKLTAAKRPDAAPTTAELHAKRQRLAALIVRGPSR